LPFESLYRWVNFRNHEFRKLVSTETKKAACYIGGGLADLEERLYSF